MNKRKGFTLVELLIVVLILGALAAIALPRLADNVTKAKANACRTNIDTINSQLELSNANNGSYPANITTFLQDPQYFPEGVPQCPDNGSYSYISTTDGQTGYGRAQCSVTAHNQ